MGCTLRRPPRLTGRKVGMTSSPHGLYAQGYTRTTMAGTERSKTARWSKSQKAGPSSDWGLKLALMKLESLVIAYQQVAVNTFPGLVHTARHTMEVICTGSRCPDSHPSWNLKNKPLNYKGATGAHRNDTEKTSVNFCDILWLKKGFRMGGIGSRLWYGLWLGWSRNKVAVRECAAGSPPL